MRTVLISGAGIAGLSLAYWLRHHGFHPVLVERAPAPRSGGQAIDVRGAARDVVARMGILDAVKAHHTGTHGIAWLNEKGKRVGTMTPDDFGDSGGIIAEIEVLRGDLLLILADAVGDVEVLYGTVITDIAEGSDGVKVTFDNAPPRTVDIVVGADGLRSGVRSLMFGQDKDFVRDLGYYLSYFPARTDLDLNGWELMYNLPAGNGVGGRVALLYPVGSAGELRALLGFVSPDLGHDRRGVQAQKDLLANVFAGAGWQLPELIDQMRRADDLYFARVGQVRLDEWYRGRTVLLGDSAFGGSLGMGTSMAIVGAYVLAGELAAACGDHQAAFPRYHQEMRDYVAVNSKRPPGAFAPRTRRGIWMRNQFMRALPHLPGGGKMMGGIQKAANSITLKEYPPAT
ncbi:FAD-dependent monooxygenase [Actinokineospora globicatena]|uniref:FAD-dependent monooxygenase n=1 Tax=Actinokineospora globicatena TaxID=103729 RepID=UPI0020A433DD|nr:FAD-dependent monooxygenase [Actinokineospora globicatena]MCP2306079.1 2-polyprenyl-6-methoxyphenol hydroxylase [Actinokineospora globicatena]GLW80047.1 FAD-dependent oxidoreductase [Actinokineospora globicatena]GLW86876.1 FAD-dependent oxidoreductase [Actinokineospora globicatena]